MSESSSRPRRSLVVVLLDAMLGLVTAVQTGNMPGSRSGAATRPRSRAGLVWLVAGVVAAVGGTAILVSAVLRTPGGLADLPPGGLAAAPAPTSGAASSGATKPSPSSASPAAVAAIATRSASTSAKPPSRATSPGGARLTATYAAAAGTGVLGYRATVTVDSQGPVAAQDWRLTITLPRPSLQIGAVSGATVDQDGTVWTFTPVDATRRIAAGDSVVVAFDVRGATLVDAAPTACLIGDTPCAGLPRG